MKPALIIIDCQNDFIKGHSSYECEMLDKNLIARIKNLLLWGRGIKLPIIFTQHSIKSDKSNVEFGEPEDVRVCIEDTIGWKIIKELKPLKSEYIILKDKYDAFVNTKLEDLLKKLKIDTVIFAGVLTNNCVRATAEGAHYRNFKIIIVSDCTGATSCNKGLTSKKVHELTLEDLKCRMYEAETMSLSSLKANYVKYNQSPR